MYDMDDLIAALRTIESINSEIAGWDENDGEETLNSFADSGVGGSRSEELRRPIAEAQQIASRVLKYTVDGRLHRVQRSQLGNAGFPVDSDGEAYTTVFVHPTDEAHDSAESDDLPQPDKMLLILVEDQGFN